MQAHSAASEPPGPNAHFWREAGALVAAALAAQAVTVALTKLAAAVALVTAMLATIAFAGMWLGLSRRAGADAPSLQSSLRSHLYTAALTMAGVFLGGCVIAAAFGEARSFYCDPAVPWRIEIAIFGSFAVGFWTRMAGARGRARLVYPFTLIAFLWIAPFYGFFSGPVFLAIGVLVSCVNRGFFPVLLAAFGMIVGERLGHGLGVWLSSPRDSGDAQT